MEGEYRESASQSSNDIDPITLDEIDITQHKRKYVFLIGAGRLQIFEVESIKPAIDVNPTNPLTRNPLSPEEINYINFYYQCYQKTKNLPVTKEYQRKLADWYISARGKLSPAQISVIHPNISELVHCFVTINDLQDHFKNYDRTDSDVLKYERSQAEAALAKAEPQSWLLRYSSMNRPEEASEQERLKRMGIVYYAMSIKAANGRVNHALLTHQLGKGWAALNNIWFTNFIDAIEYMLNSGGLSFNKYISEYVADILEPSLLV